VKFSLSSGASARFSLVGHVISRLGFLEMCGMEKMAEDTLDSSV
jgi:hypothetical protein